MDPASLFAPGGIVQGLSNLGNSIGDSFKSYALVRKERDDADMARTKMLFDAQDKLKQRDLDQKRLEAQMQMWRGEQGVREQNVALQEKELSTRAKATDRADAREEGVQRRFEAEEARRAEEGMQRNTQQWLDDISTGRVVPLDTDPRAPKPVIPTEDKARFIAHISSAAVAPLVPARLMQDPDIAAAVDARKQRDAAERAARIEMFKVEQGQRNAPRDAALALQTQKARATFIANAEAAMLSAWAQDPRSDGGNAPIPPEWAADYKANAQREAARMFGGEATAGDDEGASAQWGASAPAMKGRSLAAAMALPINRGKSEADVRADLIARGYTPTP